MPCWHKHLYLSEIFYVVLISRYFYKREENSRSDHVFVLPSCFLTIRKEIYSNIISGNCQAGITKHLETLRDIGRFYQNNSSTELSCDKSWDKSTQFLQKRNQITVIQSLPVRYPCQLPVLLLTLANIRTWWPSETLTFDALLTTGIFQYLNAPRNMT